MLAAWSQSYALLLGPASGHFKKSGKQSIGRSKGGLTTKILMMAQNDRRALEFILSPGNKHDAPQGRLLMETVGRQKNVTPLIMDRAFEDDYTRYIAQTLNFKPIVPPKKSRKNPWDYDKTLYKLRNEIERLFRLIQGFRRVFVRFDKLDIMYEGFVQLALVYVAIK